ncbi:hypothetical protein E2C01_010130 [Portunus trituberculatus]|uniref:Uncharacterized protein n=1 Tax=Portunus trituberculatus TaxID=210409 RepID=A0A5B7D7Q6_PORTR|nr:hypothetical protein [Portunus trituberculatus]
MPGEDTLHGVVGGVTRSGCSTFIAGRAQLTPVEKTSPEAPPTAKQGKKSVIWNRNVRPVLNLKQGCLGDIALLEKVQRR